jgi:hypothetical protein
MADKNSKPQGQPRSADEIERNLRTSLEAARDGLRQLWRSIEESKMASAVQQYRALQALLIQQRLWAHGNGRKALVPVFAEIARAARDLHRVFHSYAEVMRALKELDRLTVAETAPEAALDQSRESGAPGSDGDPAGTEP